MNIIDYAESQMADFKNVEFNQVDSLILSKFIYINFNKIVPMLEEPQTSVRIADLLKAEYITHMLQKVGDQKNNYRLLLALGMSPRFRNIQMCFFSESTSVTEQKQFAAVTYLLDDKTAYIAYRGTDSTIVGWKEDLNMTFISPIPAQLEGVAYLNTVAQQLPHELMTGGHSKGGNIAVYSALDCHPSIQDRIVGIYSHDGPGFKDEIFASEKYTRIKSKINKTLPQSSLVGMLLQNQEDYLVVESTEFWLMQHNPFSWVVNQNDFQYVQGITKGAEHINTTISQWLTSLDDEKRELFITTLYNVIESIGIVKLSDFSEAWYKKVAIAMETAKDIDAETKHFILETIKSLLALYVKNFRFPFKVNENIASAANIKKIISTREEESEVE